MSRKRVVLLDLEALGCTHTRTDDEDDFFLDCVQYNSRPESGLHIVASDDDENYISSEESESDDLNVVLTKFKDKIPEYKSSGIAGRKRQKRFGKLQQIETSDEVINVAIKKKCCNDKQCLQKFPKSSIRQHRKKFYSMTQQKQSKFILDTIRKSCAETESSHTFIVDGRRVCQSAWLIIFGVKERRFRLLRSRVKSADSVEDQRRGQKYPSENYVTAMNFMTEYVKNFGEPQPDCTEIHLPSCLTKFTVFKDYLLHCEVAGLSSLRRSRFYEMWHAEFYRVKIRKHQKFTKCDHCTLFKEALLKKLSKEEKEELQMKRKAHFTLQLLARQKYYKHREKAKSKPQQYLSVIIDNMDQAKTTLPRFSLNCKTDNALTGIHHHVTGALCHNMKTDFAYTWTDKFHPDSNVTLNCLMKVLHHVKEVNGSLPPTLYLQADNCSKDNKNHFVLMFLAALVKAGIFEKVKLSFLMVGHTHEDVDQLFSRISNQLCQQNATTLPELHTAIKNCSTPAPETQHLEAIYNFKEVLDTIPRVEGIKQPHVFRFTKDNNNVKLSVKDWPLDEDMYTSVRLDKIPSIDAFSQALPVRKNPKIDGIISSMRKDLPKWKNSGRLSMTQYNWWVPYLQKLEDEAALHPNIPLPVSLLSNAAPPNHQHESSLDSNLLQAINRHIRQLQTSSEIRVVRPRPSQR